MKCAIGRDDFNFSSWIFSASSHIAPVTERNTLDFSGYGVGGLLYPPRTLPMWQNSFQECKNVFFGFPLLKSDLMLAIFTKTSSVTKRNIVDRMDKVLGMAYTPHQCSYSDRNDPHWEKNLQFGRMCSKYVQNIVKHSLWTVVKALVPQ